MTPNPREIAPGVLMIRTMVSNLYLVREDPSWVLLDAGLSGYADTIQGAAREFLGSIAPPVAVVLTHGHFDHVGSLPALLQMWDVPVFAHALERPYLTGRSPYPPPDPLVGGGLISTASKFYPRGPIDVGSRFERLPDTGGVPGLRGWSWIATPGHTAGHVSFFRQRDRLLIAGDAVCTVRPESLTAVVARRPELHGPPAYETQDWRAAAESVGRIAALEPETLASGHGDPQSGAAMRLRLRSLAARFSDREVPRFGRYVKRPAITDERGIVRLPPDPLPKVAAGLAVAAVVAWGLSHARHDGVTRSS
jgi:glyoxylase-like metal-dependent hydrolase (beta-lactamase superfamily II)